MSSLSEVPFHAVISNLPECVVVAVSGEIDVSSAKRFWEAIQLGLQEHRPLVVDLTGITFMDSSGLAVLVKAQRHLAASAGQLVIRTAPGTVRRVLGVSGLDRVLNVDPLAEESRSGGEQSPGPASSWDLYPTGQAALTTKPS